jgi:BirA family transcriptional regulator, biotin operon repressor / biotin---[acetyl-CoA-carboxylase] ligase
MTTLDETALRALLDACMITDVEKLEVFRELDSTNSFLRDSTAPARGAFRVALADHQTAGRGRNENRWLSAPGRSLCLSLAHTFRRTPRDIPPLTLALGIGAADVLESCGVPDVMLKWPNDLMAGDAKLGGILTEAQHPRRGEAMIVAGIGLNVDLPEEFGDVADPAYATAVDLHSLLAEPPSRETLAVALILGWRRIFREYETAGFEAFEERYARLDWLQGKRIVVATAEERVEGLAAGVSGAGALLVETESGTVPVVSGSILAVGAA